MPWLLRAEPWDSSLGAVRPVYLSDTGFTSAPEDTPGDTYWQRRIDVPLSLRSSLFSGSEVGGESQVEFGDVLLENGDGALDELALLDWDGRLIEIRHTPKPAPVWADFQLVFSGTAEALLPGDTITIELRSLKALLDVPLQSNRWAGTGGAEGAETLKDRRKPLALGILRQLEPVASEEAALILAYGDGPCGGVLECCDGGRPLIAGPDYPDLAALRAATLTGWGYATCDALGRVRLAERPASIVTLDVLGRSRGAPASVASLPASVPTVAGRHYALRCMVSRAAGSITLRAGGVALGSPITASGRVVLPFRATGSSTSLSAVTAGGWSGSVGSIEVVEWLARFGDLVEWMIPQASTLTAADFAAGTVDAINALAPQPLGLWYDGSGELTVRQAIDELARGPQAWWGFDAERKIRLGRLDPPAAVPDFTFTDRDDFELRALPVERRLKTQTIGYGRRWRPLSEQEIVAAVTGDARSARRTEWRTEAYTDAGVAAASLLAREERHDTPLDSQADAAAEAQRRVALYGTRRQGFEATVPFTAGLRAGHTVRLTDPRYGLAAGRNLVVVQLDRDAAPDTLRLVLWG